MGEAAAALAQDKACARLAEEVEDLTEVKKKKKKRKKEKDLEDGSIEILKVEDASEVAAAMTAELNSEPAIKKKKSKKRRREEKRIRNQRSLQQMKPSQSCYKKKYL